MDEHFDSIMKLFGPMLDLDFNPDSPVDRTLAFRALRDSIMDEEYYKMMGAVDPSTFRPTFIPFAEFQRQTKEYSRQIFSHWNRLHDILDHHEDQLRKRWIKKTREQRTRILTNAWPNMPATHRPDFSLQRDSREQLADSAATRFRDVYLLPYINLEDLLKSKNLLLLLNSRGRNLPDVFASFDILNLRIPVKCGAVTIPQIDGYSMKLDGETSPETYGGLVAHGNMSLFAAKKMMSAGIKRYPGEGLLVLEVQEKLMLFLVKCAEAIVHDLLSLKTTMSSSQPSVLPSVIPIDVQWPSVAAAAAEAPYRVPVQFDFARLQLLVNAKRSEAEDHVWSLREDPGYFRHFIYDCSEHRKEHLVDESGRRHSDLGKPRFWDKVFSGVLADAYSHLWVWDVAVKHITKLDALRHHYGPSLSPISKLPIDYEEAFLRFKDIVDQGCVGMTRLATQGIYASPQLRSHYFGTQQGEDMMIARRNSHRRDYFLWLLEHLGDPVDMEKLGPKVFLDELERVIRSDSATAGIPQKARISAWVSNALSDLAIFAEIEDQVYHHQPNIGVLHTVSAETTKKNFNEDTAELFLFQDQLKELEPKLAAAGLPLGKFDYPSEKRRTASTTDKLRQAELKLDAFWNIVDEHYIRKTGKSIHQILSKALTPRTLERTPEWIEPPKPATIPTSPVVDDTEFTTLDLAERTQVLEKDITIPIKIKLKTRSAATEAPMTTIDVGDDDASPIASSTIPVSKRAYKTFSALFYNPAGDVLPGEIPWTEFLHALSSAGFSVEKQNGSAWLFVPPSLMGRRPIIFHEPHPSSKILIHVARRHGRRLARAYGWTRETFVVA